MPPQKGSVKNIINIINYAIKELHLFTNSKTHDVVINRYESDPDNETVNYIATSGYPKEEMQCRECGYMLPYPAAYPDKIPYDFIQVFTNEGDLILDPMCGSGSTLVAARVLNRNYIGIDISKEYCELSRARVKVLETNVLSGFKNTSNYSLLN